MSARGRAVDWVAQYEALRAHALGDAPVGFVPLGLGVLHQRGAAAWMALGAGGDGGAPRNVTVQRGREAVLVDVSPLKLELVRLLAGAALALRRVS